MNTGKSLAFKLGSIGNETVTENNLTNHVQGKIVYQDISSWRYKVWIMRKLSSQTKIVVDLNRSNFIG